MLMLLHHSVPPSCISHIFHRKLSDIFSHIFHQITTISCWTVSIQSVRWIQSRTEAASGIILPAAIVQLRFHPVYKEAKPITLSPAHWIQLFIEKSFSSSPISIQTNWNVFHRNSVWESAGARWVANKWGKPFKKNILSSFSLCLICWCENEFWFWLLNAIDLLLNVWLSVWMGVRMHFVPTKLVCYVTLRTLSISISRKLNGKWDE